MLSDLKAAWAAGSKDDISLIAAGISHYALLALVPSLVALVLVYGIFADPATVAKHIKILTDNLPSAAATIIGDQLRNVTEGQGTAKGLGLIAALGIALWSARNAARALMTGLNIAFHAGEARSFVRGNLVALAITVGGIAGLILLGGASGALAVIAGPAGTIASAVLLLTAATGRSPRARSVRPAPTAGNGAPRAASRNGRSLPTSRLRAKAAPLPASPT